ncbi:MAG: sigma-54 dependent transcriptional regulator [Gemmataceae bacterium]
MKRSDAIAEHGTRDGSTRQPNGSRTGKGTADMKHLAQILVVDDEPIIRDSVDEYLSSNGFAVRTVGSGEEALALVARDRFDVVLCDVNLPGLDGLDVLDRVAQISPETFVLLITAYATVDSAVEAFQKGAHDYLMKPIILHEVLSKIHRLLKQRDVFRENQWLRRELNRDSELDELVAGRSRAMKQSLDLARKVGPLRNTVLILGESGTGKELFARAIHKFGQVAKPMTGLFLAVNCAAIPENLLENQLFGHRKGAFTGADKDRDGMFVHAGNGTVFLDEIGETPLPIQAKLLRAIEQKEVMPVGANEPINVDARIIAATNKDLKKEVEAGRFREDLYYRLNVVSIRLPALRERREDIPELVERLLAKHAQNMGKKVSGCTHEAMQLLMDHPWKGNVRELDNALQRALILGEGPLIAASDLPSDFVPTGPDPFAVDDLNAALERFERLHIERILKQTTDKRDAAKRLGIGLSSLYRKIEQLNLGGGN